MNLFTRKNLIYQDYRWTTVPSTDPRVSGKPDGTLFHREEGNEMVYLINKLMILWDYRFANSGNKMEKLIHDSMPAEIKTQKEVQDWLKSHL